MTSNDFVMQIIGRRKKHPKTHKKPFYLLKSGFGEHPTYKKHIFATKQVNYAENQYKGKELVKNVSATTLQKSFADKISMEFKPDKNGQFSSEDIVNCYNGLILLTGSFDGLIGKLFFKNLRSFFEKN